MITSASKVLHCPMNYNLLDNTQWSHPHPKFYVIAITDCHLYGGARRTLDVDVAIGRCQGVVMGQSRTLDADVAIGCHYGDYS